MREIDDDEGRRLVRIVRRDSGSVVTWRRAQLVLLSAQGMDLAGIATVAFTSQDRDRDVIHNFNADGFSSLYPQVHRRPRSPPRTMAAYSPRPCWASGPSACSRRRTAATEVLIPALAWPRAAKYPGVGGFELDGAAEFGEGLAAAVGLPAGLAAPDEIPSLPTTT